MSSSSASAGAGGGPHAAAGGEARIPPTECRFISPFGLPDVVYTLRGFNTDTILVVNGPECKDKTDIVNLLTQIGMKVGKSNGADTQILIKASAPKYEQERDKVLRLSSEERVKSKNFGVVVPPEHSLAYAKKLFERYEILKENEEWKEESQATNQRKSKTIASSKFLADYNAGNFHGTNNPEYRKENADKFAAKRTKRARDEDGSVDD